jgi:hypothetical protein
LKHAAWTAEETIVDAGPARLASALRAASAALARLAARIGRTKPPPRRIDARLEFHAEAGAPEGALYFDGKLVGWLPGVQRL